MVIFIKMLRLKFLSVVTQLKILIELISGSVINHNDILIVNHILTK